MKNLKKKLITLGLIGVAAVGIVGCDDGSEQEQREQQRQMFKESNRELGMPNIHNFTEKRMAKIIWELRDKSDLTTYAYSVNMNGKYVYLGRCIGFGLPYTTQYTNPNHADGTKQCDPNGLFSSETTNATWLMLVNEETNKPEIIYAEPEIIITQHKLPKRLVAEWSLPNNY